MAYVIAIIVVVLVVAAAVAIFLRRRNSSTPIAPAAADTGAVPPVAAPMTGLESALAQVTDREGRPIGERIDAEAEHVEDLRVPDDTGPLLRRALDHVEHDPDSDPDDSATPTAQ